MVGLVAWLPFDVASGAGTLGHDGRFSCHDGFHGFPQVGTGDGLGIPWSGTVKLAAVSELQRAVEQVKIGRASRHVGFGDGLIGIQQIRKAPAGLLRKHRHFIGRIGGVVLNIVRVDGDHSDALGLAFFSECGEGFSQMNHKWAVIADEHDQQTVRAAQVVEGKNGAGGISELDFRGGAAEREDAGGGDFSHD